MRGISHFFHRAIHHIPHPHRSHHAENGRPVDAHTRPSPTTQQGPVSANPNTLGGTNRPATANIQHNTNHNNQPQTFDAKLHNRDVKLPEHSKISHDDLIFRCREGEKIFSDVMNSKSVKSSPENVSKLMWYLQARGSEKVSSSAGLGEAGPQNFKMGAFSVEDKNHCLETFLNKADSYSRESSHLKGYQHLGNDYQPRGLDLNGKDACLPNGRKTILFARMPEKSETNPTGMPGKNMLFIKMEEHGCHRPIDKLRHGINYIPTFLEQHCGRVKTDQGIDNRERIPVELKNQYSDIDARYLELFDSLDLYHDSSEDIELPLDAVLSKTGGVRTMINGLTQMHDSIMNTMANNHELFNSLPEEKTAPILSLIADMKMMQEQLQSRDHSDLRIGNEIIITADEQLITFKKENMSLTLNNTEAQDRLNRIVSEKISTVLPGLLENVDQNLAIDKLIKDMDRGQRILSSTGGNFDYQRNTSVQEISDKVVSYISDEIRTLPGTQNVEGHYITTLAKAITGNCNQSLHDLPARVFMENFGKETNLQIGISNQHIENSHDFIITPISSNDRTTVIDLIATSQNRVTKFVEQDNNNTPSIYTGPSDGNFFSLSATVRFTMNNTTGRITVSVPGDIQYEAEGNLTFSPAE